jgi:uncharacterized protein YndB with AHSA1/START domain
MSVKNGNEVKVEKLIKRPAKDVFRALSEGRLFNNCGAAIDQMKIDFREGGKYQLEFQNAQMKVCGKFTEIVPEKTIRFTWGDVGSDSGFPMTEVLIKLFADGAATRVVIEHTGFKTKDDAEGHDYGWTSGLDDMTTELLEGRIRLLRVYPVGRERLYQVCSDIRRVFGSVADTANGEIDFRVGGRYRFPTKKHEMAGAFEEIVPGKKIVFSWLSGCDGTFEKPTRVTLLFDDEEDGESSIELIHEFLPADAVKGHRAGWECFVTAIYGLLKS